MKTLNLLIIALVTLFVSCGKDDNNLLEVDLESIQGRWELRDRFGGQAVVSSPDYEIPDSQVIEFDGQRFRRISDGVTYAEGTYEIVEVEVREIDGNEFSRKIIFNDETENGTSDQFVRLSGNRLILSMGSIASDGVTDTYEKI
ncbi:hypothetical protein H8S90_15215 [Olivibacter sp. SDN3]|uniref:hypothetical protein n=1 Tax=Olivibacter sp. SDN3 TaxID=2764720 RepID=UPI00165123BC|nr:hypothetical protein [Olivibacter sp. SDN3]QNL48152.1 hypothetical protein H8S90_15215 [Olivibacter sp. SDN3]